MAKEIQTNQTQVAENAQAKDLYVISDYLKKLKFSPRLMGVDEVDVWRKIETLCQLYEDALTTERAKNEKLTAKLRVCTAKIREYLAAEQEEQEEQEEQPNG